MFGNRKRKPTASVDPSAETVRVYIIDNGGTPFVVELMADGVARVLRQRQGLSYDAMHKIDVRDVSRQDEWLEPWRDFRYTRAFVGLDPSEERRCGSWFGRMLFGRPAWWHGGNTLLLELAPLRYLCVCNTGVFEFSTPPGDEIVRYVSVMGNNAVPYPYAVGKKNTYLMIEDVFIPNDLAAQRGDPYQVFYETDLKSPTCTDDKTLRTQRAAAAAFKATHGTPDVKVLHPRHEPDMVC